MNGMEIFSVWVSGFAGAVVCHELFNKEYGVALIFAVLVLLNLWAGNVFSIELTF